MSEPVTTTYREITLTLNEHDNSWMCELFSKPAESLVAARERIDKKLDTEKKQPFKRFNAYADTSHLRGDRRLPYRLVEVTSLTDDNAAWVTENGVRQKISLWRGDARTVLFPQNLENDATIKAINELHKEVAQIQEKIAAECAKLVPIKAV